MKRSYAYIIMIIIILQSTFLCNSTCYNLRVIIFRLLFLNKNKNILKNFIIKTENESYNLYFNHILKPC
jgi:hypothetical protein